MNRLGMTAGVLLMVTAVSRAGAQAPGAACDRACLIKIADSYFAAMVAHAPSKAPIAPTAKFTEQAKPLAVGEGLWKTITEGPTTFKIYVSDPVSGQLGAIAMVKSEGQPTELALRLKVENGRITEAEHLMARITSEPSLANLTMHRPSFTTAVAPSERLPRELLLLFAHGYYDAIEQSDGNAVPFADDCVRRENGMQTAGPRADGPAPAGRGPRGSAGQGAATPAAPRGSGPGAARTGGPGGGLPGAAGPAQMCGPQLTTRVMSYIDSLDLRRVWIADPENGLVFGLSMFRHAMTNKTYPVLNPDGTTREQTMNFQPFDLPAAHIIKVQGNKIRDIEAMGFMLPLYSKNGWSEFLR